MSHAFCRYMLIEQMKVVREKFTHEEIKRAWVWSGDRKNWEFHGPNGEYDYNLRTADCAWSAKAEGWSRLCANTQVNRRPSPSLHGAHPHKTVSRKK